MSDGFAATPSGGQTRRLQVVLAALGAWTIVVPYAARPLGLEVDVASTIEVVDHVLPGVLVVLLGAWLARRSGGGPPAIGVLVASGVCALAGVWVLATHVPLLADAAAGREPWGAALWHSATAPVIIVLAFITALGSGPADDGGA